MSDKELFSAELSEADLEAVSGGTSADTNKTLNDMIADMDTDAKNAAEMKVDIGGKISNLLG